MTVSRRFIILDRDGTIIHERHYLAGPSGVELIPGAARALAKLRALGCGLVVATNQAGLSRGYFDRAALDRIHERLRVLLENEGVVLDGIYVCTHHPDDGCSCRKPKTGLLEQAASEHGFDPRSSIVIGDKAIDIECGKNAGAATVLVRTGYEAEVERAGVAHPDYIVDDLSAASRVIGEVLRSG